MSAKVFDSKPSDAAPAATIAAVKMNLCCFFPNRKQ